MNSACLVDARLPLGSASLPITRMGFASDRYGPNGSYGSDASATLVAGEFCPALSPSMPLTSCVSGTGLNQTFCGTG